MKQHRIMDHKQNAGIIPTFRYKNAQEAIEWLVKAFGFSLKIAHPDGDGGIAHAQLVYNNSMIMLSTTKDGAYDELIKHPKEVHNFNTSSLYIIVDDLKQHYERAIECGAEICLPLTEQDYGGSIYTCRDPEGYLWNFGSYDPWAKE